MDNKQFWDNKWAHGESRPASNFAKRTWQYLKNKNYHTLLDLGCGNGNDTLYFYHKGLSVTGIDLSDQALSQLKSRDTANHITLIQADITSLSLPHNSFDVIYANLSLHYFDDATTQDIFNHLSQIIKHNGTIFVKCKSTKDARNGNTDRFYNFFTEELMAKYLAKFRIVKIRATSSVYNNYKSNFIEAIATKT